MITQTGKQVSAFKRQVDDWYVEPRWVSRGLFVAFDFGVSETGYDIWDPACGQGHIVSEALSAGLTAFGTDIVRRSPLYKAHDFLNEKHRLKLSSVKWIVINPPYKLTEAFLHEGLMSAEKGVWLFQRVNWMMALSRISLLKASPLTHVFVCSPRPSCLPGTHRKWRKASGGMHDFAWFGFVKNQAGQPITLDWIVKPS